MALPHGDKPKLLTLKFLTFSQPCSCCAQIQRRTMVPHLQMEALKKRETVTQHPWCIYTDFRGWVTETRVGRWAQRCQAHSGCGRLGGTAILSNLEQVLPGDSEDGDGMSPAPHRPWVGPWPTRALAPTAGGPVVPSLSLAPSPCRGWHSKRLLPLCGARENEVK